MATITRSQWGAGPHRAGIIATPVRELWLHHAVTPFWVGAQAARELQRIARGRNFVDISYSWLTDRQGNEIEGRGWGRQGAHTAGRNSISHAVCLVGNLETSAMPDGMIRGAVRLVRRHRAVGPGRITGPHSAAPGASTACPGRHARARIQAINTAASGTPTPPPQEVDMSLTEAQTRKIVREELDRDGTRLHHIAMALQLEAGKRVNYLGGDIKTIVDQVTDDTERSETMHDRARRALLHARRADQRTAALETQLAEIAAKLDRLLDGD